MHELIYDCLYSYAVYTSWTARPWQQLADRMAGKWGEQRAMGCKHTALLDGGAKPNPINETGTAVRALGIAFNWKGSIVASPRKCAGEKSGQNILSLQVLQLQRGVKTIAFGRWPCIYNSSSLGRYWGYGQLRCICRCRCRRDRNGRNHEVRAATMSGIGV